MIIEKQAPPGQDPVTEPSGRFATDLPCYPTGVFTSEPDLENVCRGIAPGTYTVTETAAVGDGAEFVSLSCGDANSSVDPETRTATIRVEPNEMVRCVFVNRASSEADTARGVTVTDTLPPVPT